MKFDPSWKQVALTLGLLAIVLLAHIFAPLAVAVITSMVSTIIGAVYVNFRQPEDSKPSLSVIDGGKQ